MVQISSMFRTVVWRDDARALGDCLVCGDPVRERDDRMRLRGRHVHTRCAGYRLRQVARPRIRGSRNARATFTGD
jgi:hypothetical protein